MTPKRPFSQKSEILVEKDLFSTIFCEKFNLIYLYFNFIQYKSDISALKTIINYKVEVKIAENWSKSLFLKKTEICPFWATLPMTQPFHKIDR